MVIAWNRWSVLASLMWSPSYPLLQGRRLLTDIGGVNVSYLHFYNRTNTLILAHCRKIFYDCLSTFPLLWFKGDQWSLRSELVFRKGMVESSVRMFMRYLRIYWSQLFPSTFSLQTCFSDPPSLSAARILVSSLAVSKKNTKGESCFKQPVVKITSLLTKKLSSNGFPCNLPLCHSIQRY